MSPAPTRPGCARCRAGASLPLPLLLLSPPRARPPARLEYRGSRLVPDPLTRLSPFFYSHDLFSSGRRRELEELLRAVKRARDGMAWGPAGPPPLLLKIAPDLTARCF